jgi:hypothetical protein
MAECSEIAGEIEPIQDQLRQLVINLQQQGAVTRQPGPGQFILREIAR